jgi:hypothetical protein
MARPRTTNPQTTPTSDAVEQRIVALAEQLGRAVGTLQARADGWIDLPGLNQQLTRIRDNASALLGHLGGEDSGRVARPPRPRKQETAKAASRSGGKVDAPGKAHRKAPARKRAKKSDETIAKARGARQMRRSPRG